MGIIESIALFIYNTAAVLTTITQLVAGFLFWIALLVIYPLSLSKRCRYACGLILFLISQFFYLYLWLHSVTTSFHVAPWGVALAGALTVAMSVPIAVVGSMIQGSWLWVGGFCAAVLVAMFFHYTASLLINSGERFKKSI